MSLKIGDKVQLKSGGPEMTVIQVGYDNDLVKCAWFNQTVAEYSYMEQLLPIEALTVLA